MGTDIHLYVEEWTPKGWIMAPPPGRKFCNPEDEMVWYECACDHKWWVHSV